MLFEVHLLSRTVSETGSGIVIYCEKGTRGKNWEPLLYLARERVEKVRFESFLISAGPVLAVSSRHAANRRRRTQFSGQCCIGAADLVCPRETVQRQVAALPATTHSKMLLFFSRSC